MAEADQTYERHQGEAEAVLLCISAAIRRAEKARDRLEAEGADDQLLAALESSRQALADEHRRLMHSTYYPAPEQGTLAA